MSIAVTVPHGILASDESDPIERDLHTALVRGFINQDNHDRQLRELRARRETGGSGVLVSLPTRAHGSTDRLDLRDQWTCVSGPYHDTAAARAAISAGGVVHGNNGGAWKYQTHRSGGGCKHYLKCSGHEDCPVLCRVRTLPTGQCNIQVTTQVMHGTQTSPYKRKNSPFTRTMENACGSMARSGYTPKECKESLQSLVLHGGHATKDPAGGVLGSLDDRCVCGQHMCSHRMRTHCACAQAHAHTHPTCTYSVCARHACTCHIPTCDICTCHTYTCVCLMGAYDQVSMTTISLNTRV